MKKKMNKKGFTLAELLIVIAIIGILIAIAIPVFTNALEGANKAVDDANIRAAYAQYMSDTMLAAGYTGGAITAPNPLKDYVVSKTEALRYYDDVKVENDKWVGEKN